MRKIILFLLLLLIENCSLLNAQSTWFYQNPFPDVQDINSMFFFNNETGYLTGSDGRILKTNDGCQNFIYLKPNIRQSIKKIHFVDVFTGFVITDNQFYKTINSGDDWVSKLTSSGYNFNGFIFLSYNLGYMCSSEGGFWRTTNSGENWSLISSTIQTLRDIIFTDSLNGFGFSDSDKVFKTTNGGFSWDYNSFSSGDTTISMKSVSFPSNNTGYLLANKHYHVPPPIYYIDISVIYKTTDNGSNWNKIKSIEDAPAMIKFISSLTGFVSTNNRLYKTTDGGINWDFVNIIRAYSIFFASPSIGYLGSYGSELFKTSNGGANWIRLTRSSITQDIRSSFFVNDYTGYAAGEGGLLARTINGGNNWMLLSSYTGGNFTSIYFASEHTGYAVGFMKDTIYKTIDDGITWQRQSSQTNAQALYCIQFVNYLTGYACGYPGSIIKTTNGGTNWISLPTLIGSDLLSLSFTDPLNGFIVSNMGNIIKTTDGGSTFTYQAIGSTYFWCISFLNANTGFISTAYSSANIYKTTNAGLNWIPYSTGSNQQSNYVKFINENTGFIVGNAIYKTTNGGQNWFVPFFFSIHNFLWSISITSPNNIWVTGDLGVILKSTNGGSTFISCKSKDIPREYCLKQNYPNPFNPVTRIKFDIPEAVKGKIPTGRDRQLNVKLSVFDNTGRKIRTLVNEQLQPGTYEVTFDGSNLPSGVYFYQLRAGDYSETKKLILLK